MLRLVEGACNNAIGTGLSESSVGRMVHNMHSMVNNVKRRLLSRTDTA
jgi:hypothetical protein